MLNRWVLSSGSAYPGAKGAPIYFESGRLEPSQNYFTRNTTARTFRMSNKRRNKAVAVFPGAISLRIEPLMVRNGSTQSGLLLSLKQVDSPLFNV